MRTTPCSTSMTCKVPWERVFVAGDVEMCQKQFHATPAHVYQNYQAQIRLMVKLRFLAGVAHRIADINGIAPFPQVREMLGQLAAEVGMVEAWSPAWRPRARMHGEYFVPDRHTLYAAQVLTQQLYPRVINTLRELAGGGMIMLPSSVDDFANPEIAALIERTQQSPAANARREGEVLQARLGRGRLGIRIAAHAVRDVLCRRDVRDHAATPIRCYDWAAPTRWSTGFSAATPSSRSSLTAPEPIMAINKPHLEFRRSI